MIELETLLKDNWENTEQQFAHLLILRRNDERILYDTKKNNIYMTYKVEYEHGQVKTIYKVNKK